MRTTRDDDWRSLRKSINRDILISTSILFLLIVTAIVLFCECTQFEYCSFKPLVDMVCISIVIVSVFSLLLSRKEHTLIPIISVLYSIIMMIYLVISVKSDILQHFNLIIVVFSIVLILFITYCLFFRNEKIESVKIDNFIANGYLKQCNNCLYVNITEKQKLCPVCGNELFYPDMDSKSYPDGYQFMYCKEKLSEAIQKVEKSSDCENYKRLYVVYKKGNVVNKDPNKAMFFLTNAADNGDYISCVLSGINYYRGYGCDKNSEKSINYLQKANSYGHELSRFIEGCIKIDNSDSFKEGILILIDCANSGDEQSKMILHASYYSKYKLAKNKKYSKWYDKKKNKLVNDKCLTKMDSNKISFHKNMAAFINFIATALASIILALNWYLFVIDTMIITAMALSTLSGLSLIFNTKNCRKISKWMTITGTILATISLLSLNKEYLIFVCIVVWVGLCAYLYLLHPTTKKEKYIDRIMHHTQTEIENNIDVTAVTDYFVSTIHDSLEEYGSKFRNNKFSVDDHISIAKISNDYRNMISVNESNSINLLRAAGISITSQPNICTKDNKVIDLNKSPETSDYFKEGHCLKCDEVNTISKYQFKYISIKTHYEDEQPRSE